MSYLKRKLREIQRGREAERIYKRERDLAYGQAQREVLFKDAYRRGLVIRKTKKGILIGGLRRGAKISKRAAQAAVREARRRY